MKFNNVDVESFVDRKAERFAIRERRAHGDERSNGSRKEPRRKERRQSLTARREMLDY